MEFRKAIPIISAIERKRKRIKIDTWDWDGPITPWSPLSYESTFKDLLQGISLQQLVAQRPKGQQNVLDLFGSGYFMRDFVFDHLIAARLENVDNVWLNALQKRKDPRDAEDIVYLQNVMRLKNRYIVPGNLYTQAPWRGIKEVMRFEHIGYIDVITCRAQGAFDNSEIISPSPDPRGFTAIFLPLFLRSYDVLSPYQGLFFTQVPKMLSTQRILMEFVDQLHEVKGLTVEIGRGNSFYVPYTLKVIKNTNAPIRELFVK